MENKTIYTLQELQSSPFDDKEINNVINVFVFSCVYNMFKFVKSKCTETKIRNIIKQDDWMNKKTWSWEEHDSFIKELALCYKNVYQYSYGDAFRRAEDFVFRFGFKVKDTQENENKHINRIIKLRYE